MRASTRSVLYPSIGLFVPFQPSLSPKESAAACRAYNEWMAEYRATDPARLNGVALVPTADVRLAAAEAAHAAALGLPAVMVRPNPLYDRDLGDRAYDPLYDTLEEHGLTLSVHEGLGVLGPTIGRERSETFSMRHAMSHPMEQMAAMASLVLLGALERHPALQVAFLESGTGWLPYWLARLDSHAEWMAESETAALRLTPTEYFARQCVICTDPDDPLAAWVVSQVGADHVMWASDFPHPDALFPARSRASSPSPRSTASPVTTSRPCCGRRRCAPTGGTAWGASPRRSARAGRECVRRGPRSDRR